MTGTHPHDGGDSLLLTGIVALLADGRDHPFDDIVATLADHLPDDPDEADAIVGEALEDHPRFTTLDDERWLDLYAILDGRCFTHRLTGLEIAIAAIPLLPDIDIPLLPFDDEIPFTDGTDGSIVFGDEDEGAGIDEQLAEALGGGGLAGPEGWLGDAAEGTLVALRLTGEGVTCRPADADPALTPATADAISRTFAALVDNDDCVDLVQLVLSWLLSDPDTLRSPHEPLTDLLDAAGLESRGDSVGRLGSGWLTPFERARAMRRAFNERMYDFDQCCHDALALAEGVFAGRIQDAPPREVARELSHGNVAEAFAAAMFAHARGTLELDAKGVLGFTDQLLSQARGAEAVGALYLESVAYEFLGQTIDAEDAARAALRADPAHPAANEAMAGYHDDRGDAARALECLRRAGVPEDDPQAQRLRATTLLSAPKVGRNDPCPCGSGRKFKVCCADRPRIPSDLRFGWLYEKALAYATHPARRGVITHLAAHTLELAGSDESPAVRAATDRRLAELAVFDDGMLEQFLERRGPLLPPGEADTATGWLDRRLAMFEVLDVQAGEGLHLRDMRTGETVWAIERVGSEDVAAGELVTARLLPDGDELRLGGPVMGVPLRLRESVLELTGDPDVDACDWAEWIGYAEAPPETQNREGEKIVLCTTRYRVPDAGAARAALAGALDADDDGDRLVEHVEVDGERLVRGFVSVDGDEVVVFANSVERAERLKALVEDLIPGVVLIEEARKTPDDIRQGAAPPGLAALDEPVPPEAADALAEYLADYARRWVDQEVPALGGLTPRQALDDPTRREDLMAILRDIEKGERFARPGAGGMPISVVRAELGLD